MLRGVTTSAEAKTALLDGLAKKGYAVMDCLQVLPDEAGLEGKTYGIVNVSVCNLRVAPDFSSEMMTQGLMGMPVRVLQRDGWYRIQTPDNYIAWVHRVGVHPVTKKNDCLEQCGEDCCDGSLRFCLFRAKPWHRRRFLTLCRQPPEVGRDKRCLL